MLGIDTLSFVAFILYIKRLGIFSYLHLKNYYSPLIAWKVCNEYVLWKYIYIYIYIYIERERERMCVLRHKGNIITSTRIIFFCKLSASIKKLIFNL